MFADGPRGNGHRGIGIARGRILFSGAVAALVLGLGGSPAAAQEKARDPAAAEQLYKAGRDLIAKGDWAAGCPKFEASMELDPVASTLLNIAKCFEHDGRLARAWAEYKRALVVNQDTPGTERRKALAGIADKAIAAIEPRLPRLRIVMSRKPDGLRISRDGQELPLALLGEAIPADPGEHEIVASAPGYGTDKRTVTLAEGKTAEVTLSLSPQASTEGASPAAKPPSAGPDPPAAATPPPAPEARSGGIPVWAWISGGLGVALVGAGIGFRVDMVAAEKTLDEKCGPERICDPNSGYDPASDNARKNRDFALFLALGGVGIAGIGAGVIGIVTAPPKSAPAPRTAHFTAHPWVAPTGFGLSLHGVY